jgi:hypothetical protein
MASSHEQETALEHRWRAATKTFVGPERELEELRIHLAETGAGQGRLMMLVGEPGIGKTRTIRELAAEAHGAGVLVLWGRGYEGDWPRPYGVRVEALAGYAGILGLERLRELLGPSAGLLAELVPGLMAAQPDGQAVAPSAVQQDRFGLYDVVATLLRAAARERPVLLVLDDLHWADRDSLALLGFVTRELQPPGPGAGARLMVVGAYREEELGHDHPLAQVLAELKREPNYERIQIGGLGEREVARYLEAVAGQELPPRVIRRLHAETEGNPFYLRELVRHLLEEGTLGGIEPGPSGEIDGAEVGVPEGVRRVVARRVSRLAEGTQALLRLAAAFPRGFEPRVLRRLLDQRDDELLDSLDEARRAGLIRAVPGRPGLYRFGHALTRHAIYDELSASRRARLHHQIAETLAALHASDPGPHLPDLAYHYAEALPVGEVGKALEYVVQTGDRAARMLAYEEAARHYERALRILDLEASPEGGSAPEREMRRWTSCWRWARPGGGPARARSAGPRRRSGRCSRRPGSRAGYGRGSAGTRPDCAWHGRRSATVASWSTRGRSMRSGSDCWRRRSTRWTRATAACARSCWRGWPPSCTSRIRPIGGSGSAGRRWRWPVEWAIRRRWRTPSRRATWRAGGRTTSRSGSRSRWRCWSRPTRWTTPSWRCSARGGGSPTCWSWARSRRSTRRSRPTPGWRTRCASRSTGSTRRCGGRCGRC